MVRYMEKTGYVSLNREWRVKMDELRARARTNLEDVLKRAFGSIKSEKSWRELEAELYEAFKGNTNAENLISKLFHSNWRVLINDVVFSEVFYHYLRIRVGPYWRAKKKPELVKSAVQEFEDVVLPLLAIPDFLEVNYDVVTIAVRLSSEYGLLPNDALLLATAEYYGVEALVSLDSDTCNREGISR